MPAITASMVAELRAKPDAPIMQCKKPLTTGRVMDKRHAWCPKCREIVDTSAFQVQSWTVGVTVVLALQYALL